MFLTNKQLCGLCSVVYEFIPSVPFVVQYSPSSFRLDLALKKEQGKGVLLACSGGSSTTFKVAHKAGWHCPSVLLQWSGEGRTMDGINITGQISISALFTLREHGKQCACSCRLRSKPVCHHQAGKFKPFNATEQHKLSVCPLPLTQRCIIVVTLLDSCHWIVWKERL